MSCVLKRIDVQLGALELVANLPAVEAYRAFAMDDDELPLSAALSSAAWADDLATPVLCESADLLRKAAVMLACVWNILRQYAMDP